MILRGRGRLSQHRSYLRGSRENKIGKRPVRLPNTGGKQNTKIRRARTKRRRLTQDRRWPPGGAVEHRRMSSTAVAPSASRTAEHQRNRHASVGAELRRIRSCPPAGPDILDFPRKPAIARRRRIGMHVALPPVAVRIANEGEDFMDDQSTGKKQ